jgi:phenylalanyl-tRNA synthetase beta chain
MNLSLKIAQYYSNVDIESVGIDEILREIGSQLGAVEEVTYFGKLYDGVVVAKVISCQKHSNADKLSVCLIDDGGVVGNVERNEQGLVQVVCGAPNVREDLVVAWLPPGVVVPSTAEKDPFVLESREIRGVVSNGMLASPSELSISDNHEGILEINRDEVGDELILPGTEFKKLYNLDDIVINLENKMFTHRPDCFGILGIARELAGIQGKSFKSPSWYTQEIDIENSLQTLELEVKVENPELVPRFMSIVLDEVNVVPSPIWLQVALTKLGVKPINNIVDITNYYSYLTGQPMHAYDYDKVSDLSQGAPQIIARKAREGDEVLLLNGKTIEVNDPSIVISTNNVVLGVGGVMGGKDSEVSFDTKRIILECANFDMYSIRRTSMRYGLFTDAVTRYTKGQSIQQCSPVIIKAVDDIKSLSGAKVASKLYDICQENDQINKVIVDIDFINSRLGTSLTFTEAKKLLENVEFNVATEESRLIIDCPFWRNDINIPEDIVEEVGRLYGYFKITNKLPKKSINPAETNKLIEIKYDLRSILASAGANEILTYTFIHGDLLKGVGQDSDKSYKLSNALSPDLQYYRQSILPSVISKVHQNIKSGYDEFALFEIGKVVSRGITDISGLPVERHKLAFLFTCNDKISLDNFSGSPYYQVKYFLDFMLSRLGIDYFVKENKQADSDTFDVAELSVFELNRSAIIFDSKNNRIGSIGEISQSVKNKFKLPKYTAGFEIDIEKLSSYSVSTLYKPISKFPSIVQDLTLSIDNEVQYADLINNLKAIISSENGDNQYDISVSPIDIYQSEGSNKKNVTLRLTINNPNRTLVKEETNKLLDGLYDKLVDTMGVIRI